MRQFSICWVMSHGAAILLLWAALALMNNGCSKKATKIQMAPDVPAPVSAPVAEPVKREPMRYAAVTPQLLNLPITVYFDFDSDALTEKEAQKLYYLVGKEFDNIKLQGYTCSIGTDDYNVGLSLARANRVRQYIGYGDPVAFGETMCNAECADIYESECVQCRKVEVVKK